MDDFVCIEEQAENHDYNWYLGAKPGEYCGHVDDDGNLCGKPTVWTISLVSEAPLEEFFCGTHASETLRDAKIHDVLVGA